MSKQSETNRWVDRLLHDADIDLYAEKCQIKEIDDALKTASKTGKNSVGRPDYVGVVAGFVIVIENKADIARHEKLSKDNDISFESSDVKNYAVNGAIHYAKHVINNSTYKKVIAFGVSGDNMLSRKSIIHVPVLMLKN